MDCTKLRIFMDFASQNSPADVSKIVFFFALMINCVFRFFSKFAIVCDKVGCDKLVRFVALENDPELTIDVKTSSCRMVILLLFLPIFFKICQPI